MYIHGYSNNSYDSVGNKMGCHINVMGIRI